MLLELAPPAFVLQAKRVLAPKLCLQPARMEVSWPVLVCVDLPGGSRWLTCACSCVAHAQAGDASTLQLMRKEIGIMQRVSYDSHIVQFFGACTTTEPAMLVMEYMQVTDARRRLAGGQAKMILAPALIPPTDLSQICAVTDGI